MRTEKKIAIIIAVIMVVLGGLITAAVYFKSAQGSIKELFGADEGEKKAQTITDSFEDIDIKIMNQDIIIKKTDESNAYLVYYESEKIKYDVSVSGDTLKIEEKKSKSFLNLDFVFGFGYPIELYLPKDEYNNIKADLEDGDLNIEDSFIFRDVDFHVESGDIYLSNLTMEELAAETGSGQICLTDSKSSYTTLKVESGDIEVENLICEKTFGAETDCGELLLTNVDAKQDFKAQTDSGDIRLKSCDGQNLELKTSDGSVTGALKTTKSFDAKASSGDVNLPANGNGGNCIIRTESGDIDISIED